MFSLRRPGADQLAAALERARAEQPAYDGVGGTDANPPAGYRIRRYQRHLGHGPATFDRAAAAVDSWAAQRHRGILLVPDDVVPDVGATVVQAIRLGPVWVRAACRVVYRAESEDRAGFAYGSLSEHPVRGEEAFLVERDAAGVVRARIVVFSRPNHWLTRLGGPITALVQARAARTYLAGIAEATRAAR